MILQKLASAGKDETDSEESKPSSEDLFNDEELFKELQRQVYQDLSSVQSSVFNDEKP
jgi:hypothetical protein